MCKFVVFSGELALRLVSLWFLMGRATLDYVLPCQLVRALCRLCLKLSCHNLVVVGWHAWTVFVFVS